MKAFALGSSFAALTFADKPPMPAGCTVEGPSYTIDGDCRVAGAWPKRNVKDAESCASECKSNTECSSFHYYGKGDQAYGDCYLHCAGKVDGPLSDGRDRYAGACVHPTLPPAPPSPGKSNWAVIVAGSSGYGNYRHQADACHAYQIMRAKGIPESNIILMAVDDVANNGMNPFRGKLFNKPTADGVPGTDVYKGCNIDYKGGAVTPENFVNVLTGKSTQGGNGKVLKSTSADNVFVNFVDHGGVGIIGFPRTVMHKSSLQGALQTMKEKQMFKHLAFYLEACESGSMFEGVNIPGMYAITASNPRESSWGTYCMPNDKVNGKHIGSCLGDLFSVNWMEDLDMETAVETLQKQFNLVRAETAKSHVTQYSDLSFTNERISDFVGKGASLSLKAPITTRNISTSSISVRELHLHNLYQAYRLASTSAERISAGDALQSQLAEQQATEATFRRITELSYPDDKEKQMAVRRLQEKPENAVCEVSTHMALRSSCAGKFDAGSGFAMQFQKVVVNICADVRRGLSLDLPSIARQACSDDTVLIV
jgi:legumain